MKRDSATRAPDFYRFARDYLHTYLPTVARRSPNTVEAHRISLECFLHYLDDQHVDRAHVSFDHFDRQHLGSEAAKVGSGPGLRPLRPS